MDNITLDDIIGSFPIDNDEREERVKGVENHYRSKYMVLNYYQLVNPCMYRSELKPGMVIRYSSRIDRLSCSSRIIKVFYNIDKNVSQLKLTAINKGNNCRDFSLELDLSGLLALSRTSYADTSTFDEFLNGCINHLQMVI